MEGRFPSHLLLSHALECTAAECVAGCPVMALDSQSGIRGNNYRPNGMHGANKAIGDTNAYSFSGIERTPMIGYNDSGGASRYFQQFRPTSENPRGALLQYLARLITPPGGIVLDPLGNNEDLQSACQDEGFTFIGIVAEEEG